jgi:threonine synthase
MDIQVASNFERFLYYSLGRDGDRVRAVMQEIRATGSYTFRDFDRDTFTSSRCTDEEIRGIIRKVHRDTGYIADPHTACAFHGVDPSRPSVVLATASPAKFPETIMAALGIEPTHPSLEALKGLPVVRHKIVADATAIRGFIEARAI